MPVVLGSEKVSGFVRRFPQRTSNAVCSNDNHESPCSEPWNSADLTVAATLGVPVSVVAGQTRVTWVATFANGTFRFACHSCGWIMLTKNLSE